MSPRAERTLRPLLAACLSFLVAACASSSGSPQPSDIPDPVFADPVAKIAETGDRVAFSQTLFGQCVHQDPDLVDSARTLDVYMTFFGGPDNRGRALAFLDTTNYLGSRSGEPPAKAIWIMGNGNWQYAAYRLANESERWSDRAAQEDPTWGGEPPGNVVRFHGQVFTDPHPVTQAQASRIWANYSAAYAEMSRLLHGSGRTVRARLRAGCERLERLLGGVRDAPPAGGGGRGRRLPVRQRRLPELQGPRPLGGLPRRLQARALITRRQGDAGSSSPSLRLSGSTDGLRPRNSR